MDGKTEHQWDELVYPVPYLRCAGNQNLLILKRKKKKKLDTPLIHIDGVSGMIRMPFWHIHKSKSFRYVLKIWFLETIYILVSHTI